MNISNQDEDIPMPINTTYGHMHGHGNLVHHNHPTSVQNSIAQSSAPQKGPCNGPLVLFTLEDNGPFNKQVKYKECLKNHAAVMGGNVTDGCGEFMPGGEEGTIEALTCSACNCHRNFHRKEVEGEHPSYDLYKIGRKVIVGHHKNILGHDESLVHPSRTLVPSRKGHAAPPHQMIIPYLQKCDDQEDGGVGIVARPPPQQVKKRYRTKFTQEQKEKMFNFAEHVGWKIQRQEEDVVQQFCQEIGVKRRVLKVWMHNNKHNLAKKNNNPSND